MFWRATARNRELGRSCEAGPAVLAGSTASLILLDPSVLSNYSVGELIVVDVDYAAGITDMGTGITGGIAISKARRLDCDAVRRVSYNVGAVAAITATGLQLDAPLLGGVPASGARVQKVVAFRGSRGSQLLSGMVGAVCAGGGERRTSVLPLSPVAGCVSGRGDDGGAGERIEYAPAARGIRGHGFNGCQRWRDRGVLPLLYSGCDPGVIDRASHLIDPRQPSLQRGFRNCTSATRSGSIVGEGIANFIEVALQRGAETRERIAMFRRDAEK